MALIDTPAPALPTGAADAPTCHAARSCAGCRSAC